MPDGAALPDRRSVAPSSSSPPRWDAALAPARIGPMPSRRCLRISLLVAVVALASAPGRAQAASGVLDPGFGVGGTRSLAVAATNNADEAFAVAVDDEG